MSTADPDEHQQTPALRVQDALGYLDQVKSKFNDQPVVYNQFLDIMKEFKSQSLDTPGVIAKVSTLFRGHTDLIVGFNTFLPPGYRIEQMPDNNEFRITTLQGDNQNLTIPLNTNATTATMFTSQPTLQQQPNAFISQQPQLQRQQAPQPLLSQDLKQGSDASMMINQTQQPNITIQNKNLQSKTVSQTSGDSIQSGATFQQQSQILPPIQQHQIIKPSQKPGTPNNRQNSADQSFNTNLKGIHNNSSSTNVAIASNPTLGSQNIVGSNSTVKQQPSLQPGAEFGFNHALNYVNKIKHRFSAKPEIYQQFLEILHAYQRDQHTTKITGSKMVLENEVYAQVARLFQNQQDLLEEFSQFLPDASGTASSGGNINSLTRVHQMSPNFAHNAGLLRRVTPDGHIVMLNEEIGPVKRQNSRRNINHQSKGSLKRQNNSLGNLNYNSLKRPKMTSLRDVSLAEAGKHGSLNEFAFFDKVRKALRSHEVYENFLRCLVLYNHEIISRVELMPLVTTFLGRFPELLKWFKEFLGFKDGSVTLGAIQSQLSDTSNYDNLSTHAAQARQRERDKMSEIETEIDYSSCKRHGASYRGLPKSFNQPKCSGRTQLCKEVLNDTLVSFPSWSEDSTFVSSRKTQFEEYIYRCEDERFELDIVIESNLLTIRVLEATKRKMDRMSSDEKTKFKLDDTLGGTSCVIHQRAIKRIYGDKAIEIIEGLKMNPAVAVPLVLRRLRAKDEEWRDAQKQFNKTWREQNEKYYLKSLDHQGISFKQNDIKYLRSKSLIKEIEDLQKENHDEDLNASTAGGADMASMTEFNLNSGVPHMVLVYKDKDMLEEACNLIIHHVKRQTSIHKDEKQKIKQLLRQFVPDLFFAPRTDLSDDEIDENDEQADDITSEKKYESNTDVGTSPNNRNTNKSDLTSSPKHISRFNRESPKLSCDESPLKDTELGEPIKPEQQKYLRDIEMSQKDDVIPLKLEESQDDSRIDSLVVLTESSPNKITTEGERGPRAQQRESLILKSPQALHNKDPEDSYHLFYLEDKWYCFLRLHHILCQRLGTIYERSQILIAEEEKERRGRKESSAAVSLRLKTRNNIEIEDYFPVFVDMIKQLLDGNLDSTQYEDMLRDMFGIYAYVAFTMDKVIQNIVRQLQHLASDENSVKCTELYIEESKIGATGGLCATSQSRSLNEANYLRKVEQILEDDNCYKVTVYKNESKLTIEFLTTENQSEEDGDSESKWSNFMNDEISKDNKQPDTMTKRLFLSRNVQRYMLKEKIVGEITESVINNIHSFDNNKSEEFNPENCKRLLVFDSGVHVSFYRRSRSRLSKSKSKQIKKSKFSSLTDKWAAKNATQAQLIQHQEWLSNSVTAPIKK